jgi:hypothetical protein
VGACEVMFRERSVRVWWGGGVSLAYSHSRQQTKVGLYNSGFQERLNRDRGREPSFRRCIGVVQCCVSGASHWVVVGIQLCGMVDQFALGFCLIFLSLVQFWYHSMKGI